MEPRWNVDRTPCWGARLHEPGGSTRRLHFHLPEGSTEPLAADGLVAAFLPHVMRIGGALHVAGALTRTALTNLVVFSESWANWRPDRYHRVSLSADQVVDTVPGSSPEAIVAWSGSLLSTHTLVRHLDHRVPGAFTLRAVVRVSGLGNAEPDAVIAHAALAQDNLPLRLVHVEGADGLVDPFIGKLPVVAAALHACAGSAGQALHARLWPVTAQLYYPRPGPFLPDVFSGGHLAVRADGGSATPARMAREIARHPALVAILPNDRGTSLAFQAAGLALPPACRRLRGPELLVHGFGGPIAAAEAAGAALDWQGRWPLALRAGCASVRFAIQARSIARWLGAAAGLRPAWPR